MKKLIRVARQIMSRDSPKTRDQMIAMMDAEIEDLPEDQRASATFDINEYSYAYSDISHYALFIRWQRPETDEEETKREVGEASWKKVHHERDLADFQRLKKQFGE